MYDETLNKQNAMVIEKCKKIPTQTIRTQPNSCLRQLIGFGDRQIEVISLKDVKQQFMNVFLKTALDDL